LFLEPTDIPAHEGENLEQQNPPNQKEQAQGEREFPAALVKGPAQPQPASPAVKTPEPRKPVFGQEEEPKGVFQQLRDDIDNASKILNPFRW
jgi:hypothetical protein